MNSCDIKIQYDFAVKLVVLDWSFIHFGIKNGFFDESVAIEYAISEVEDGTVTFDKVLEISFLLKGESVFPFIEELASSECVHEDELKEKLLFIIMQWLFDTRQEFEDPLGMVEEIYADFDYPEKIATIVRYMPGSEGETGFGKDNLELRWIEYLAEACVEYGREK
nr:DUF2247 family protein [Listeria grandensis]